MPASLDRTDRSILIGAGILVVVLAIATTLLTPARRGTRAGFPSSDSAAWDGAKAAYQLLGELGYNVKRWEQSPTDLPNDPNGKILILADPMLGPTPEEVAALREFLQRGGRIVATGEMAQLFLPGGQKFEENDDVEGDSKFPALLPSPLTYDAPEISMAAPTDWRPARVDQLAVYGSKETAAVVTYNIGSGMIVWWGSPSPLTNRRIKEPGNLALLLNSIGGKEGREILWDEYFHGARSDFQGYFNRTPLPWVGAQLALLFVLVVITYSRRYGTIRMPGKVSRLSPLEFVDTLGDLYTAGHAGAAAVRVAYQRLRFQLTRQLGLTTNATVAELARTSSLTLGWEEQSLRGTLVRADRASRTIGVTDAEALQIVRDLQEYTARLELRQAPDEKRPSE